MLALLPQLAHAEPPRAQVFAGASGGVDHGYAFVTVQPALLRSTDGSLVLRATASHLTYTTHSASQTLVVSSPGVSVGPAFVYSPRDLAFGVGAGFGARSTTTSQELGEAAPVLEVDATLSGEAFWRPQQRAALYTLFSFSAANPYFWGRVGASVPLLPPRDRAVAVWVGFEATLSGPFAEQGLDLGPVLEVPVRDLGAVFSVRVAAPVDPPSRDDGPRQGTLGAGIYWAF